jgi:AraC-like DNA-binding protein
MGNFAFEKHYRVKELAGLWGLSPKTVTRIFADEAGVIRVANGVTHKRKYATLSIPESVALRVHERLGNQAKPLPSGRPVRVIRLSDLGVGLSTQSRTVLKLKRMQRTANGECVQ